MRPMIRALRPVRHQKTGPVALLLSMLVLAGCAAGPGGGPPAPDGPAELPAASATTPAGGLSSPAPSSPSDAPVPGAGSSPSPAALMVCGDETRSNIVRILALPSVPRTTDTWADDLYTCTYALPDGALVLSVKETADPASARAHFDGLQRASASAEPIEGMANLGLPAFQTADGKAAFVKDSFVLTVDATALPGTLGPHSVSRTAFAYQVATAVLACWSE